jgi:hypothetical protein
VIFVRGTGGRSGRVSPEFTLVCQRLELFGKQLVGIDGSKLRAVSEDGELHAAGIARHRRHDSRVKNYRDAEAADQATMPPVPGMPG